MGTTLRVQVGGRWFTVEVEDPDASPVRAVVDGEEVRVQIEPDVAEAGPPEVATPQPPAPTRAPVATRTFKTPMPGVILSVAVKEGDQVVTGDEICVLEAMKMQQTLRADWSGIVGAVHVQGGQQVLDGDPIIDLA